MRIRLWILTTALAALATATAPSERSVSELLALSDSLSKAADFDSAIAVGRRALTLAEEKGGHVDTTVAQALIKLGIAHFYKADYDESRDLWSRALAIREELLGPDHPETANAMMFMGILFDQLGSPGQAVPILEKALAIFEASEKPSVRKMADCANNLAISYLKLGQYDRAAATFERAMSLYERAEGPHSDGVGGCLANLALIYQETGDYARALVVYQRALEILVESQGENHPDVALSIENIANVYVELGNYSEAEQYYERALEIKKTALGKQHPEVATTMSNLANLYVAQGRYAEAEPLLEEGLATLEAVYGQHHVDLAYILANLAKVYTWSRRHAEAETCFRRTLELREKSLGHFHPRVAMTLNNLGVLYQTQGRYGDARECYRSALDINEKVLDPHHPTVASILGNIATVYYQEGETDSAFVLYSRACTIYQENLVRNGRALSETDALNYSHELGNATSRYLSVYLASAPLEPETCRDVANAILRGKGQVSDVMFERVRAIVKETDADVRAVADSLQLHKKQLSDLFVQGPGASISKYRSRVKTLSGMISAEEMQLVEKSESFKKWQDTKNVSLDRVQNLLPDNSSLVEYVLYQRVKLDPDTIVPAYAALVIRRNADPVILDLGDAAEIDERVTAYRDHFHQLSALGSPSQDDLVEYRAVAGEVYAMVWHPIADLVGGNDLVFICPDAALNLVSFAGLPTDAGGYLVERRALHYLSSGRDLIRLTEVPEPAAGLLALGDPDYDVSLAGGNRKPPESDAAVARGALPDCDGFRNALVNPLPGTRREVEQIVAAWSDLESEPTTVLLGSEASEGAFKANAAAKRVIHLATHGYYVSADCGAESTEGTGEGQTTARNPLLLSGLFLAGSNRRAEDAPPPDGEDGVLTALEVSSMDLSGCELVVLSACETGLGEPETGEGVYGLRRAFHMAGASTVVSAMWEISDQDAASFAGRLYEQDSRTLPNRLRDLQTEIIDGFRSEGRPDHPYHWAAFIAQGEWRH